MTTLDLTEEAVEEHKLTMRVLDGTGDTEHKWDPSKPEEVEVARNIFDSLKAKGYMAFRVTGGRRGEQMRNFDPDAGEIIMTPPLQGG